VLPASSEVLRERDVWKTNNDDDNDDDGTIKEENDIMKSTEIIIPSHAYEVKVFRDTQCTKPIGYLV